MESASEKALSAGGSQFMGASPGAPHLSHRRQHLNSLLSQHVVLVDEIQRSAKVSRSNLGPVAILSHVGSTAIPTDLFRG